MDATPPLLAATTEIVIHRTYKNTLPATCMINHDISFVLCSFGPLSTDIGLLHVVMQVLHIPGRDASCFSGGSAVVAAHVCCWMNTCTRRCYRCVLHGEGRISLATPKNQNNDQPIRGQLQEAVRTRNLTNVYRGRCADGPGGHWCTHPPNGVEIFFHHQ